MSDNSYALKLIMIHWGYIGGRQMRIQFYPNTDLEKILSKKSKELGVSLSTLVVDVLNEYFGITSSLSELQIEQMVMNEIEQYVANPQNVDIEFSISVSKTYRKISMICSGKPNPLRARIGKVFAKKVGEGSFNVEQVFLPNGRPKRTTGNRAAVYINKRRNY